jgi:hypothetical protein
MAEVNSKRRLEDAPEWPLGYHRGGMALNTSHSRILRALGDTLLPSTGPGDPSGAEIVPDAVDELLASMTPADSKRVGALLVVFDLAALPAYGRRFSNLSEERRTRYVEGWMRSRLTLRRVIYRALRSLCLSTYYQDARTWSSMKYDGPLVRTRLKEAS